MTERHPSPSATTSQANHQGSDSGADLSEMVKATEQAVPHAVQHVIEQASELGHTGLDAVVAGSQQVGERARQTGRQALDYVRREPLKAVLIAAALGALAMALAGRRHRASRAPAR